MNYPGQAEYHRRTQQEQLLRQQHSQPFRQGTPPSEHSRAGSRTSLHSQPDPQGSAPGSDHGAPGSRFVPQQRTRPSSGMSQQQQQQSQGGYYQPPPADRFSQQQPPSPLSSGSHSAPRGTPPPPQPAPSHQPSSSSLGHRPELSASTASARSNKPQNLGGQPTVAGEPLHDLARALHLLKSNKFYAEGFLMKRVEVGPDGRQHGDSADGQWAKWFVQLSGTIMSTWNAAEMDEAARQGRTVPPQYLNLADAFLHPYSPAQPRVPLPTPYQFALNSAGLNRLLFCAPSAESLAMWVNAIRLAAWERSRCNEIYTGTLLGTRAPPGGWQGLSTLGSPNTDSKHKSGHFDGWLKIRLPGDTEWRRVFAVLTRGVAANSPGSPGAADKLKKGKRGSLLSFGRKQSIDLSASEDFPGDGAFSTLAFYAHRPTKRENPTCIAQHVYYAAAIFPEAEALIDRSTLFKIEGTFLNPNDGYKAGWGVGGRAEKQGFALVMLEEGDCRDMLNWLVGIADAFKLYGRPRHFSFDPRDPSSLYFALPVGPHRDRQFLDRELIDALDIRESRPRAVRAVFHNILFDRMRGVQPAALRPPSMPPTPIEKSPAQGQLAGPDSPEAEQGRRMSGQGRTESPRLPPVLPAIGEGGEPLAPKGSREPPPRSPKSQRRVLTSSSGSQSTDRGLPPPIPGPESYSSRGGSEAGSERANNYPNYLSSPLSPGQDANGSPFHSQASQSPNFSRPLQSQGSPALHSPNSNATHLSYAAGPSEHGEWGRPSQDTTSTREGAASTSESSRVPFAYSSSPRPGSLKEDYAEQLSSEPSTNLSSGPSQNMSTMPTQGSIYSQGSSNHQQYQPQVDQPWRRSTIFPSPQLAQQETGSRPASPPLAGAQPSHKVEKVRPAAGAAVEYGSYRNSPVPQGDETAHPSEDPTPHNGSRVVSPEPLAGEAGPTQPLFAEPSVDEHKFSTSSSRAISPALGGLNAVASPDPASGKTSPRPSPRIDTSGFPLSRSPVPTETEAAPEAEQELEAVSSEGESQEIEMPQTPPRPQRAPRPEISDDDESPEQPRYRGGGDGDDIHSDLLAALHFVDREDSPPPDTPRSQSSPEPSPVMPRMSNWHVGPPKRNLFGEPASPLDAEYQDPDAVETLKGRQARKPMAGFLPEKKAEPVVTAAPVQERAAEPAVSGETSPMGEEGEGTREGAPGSPDVDDYSDIPVPPVPVVVEPEQQKESGAAAAFPSSFAKNTRAEERKAAAALAAEAQAAALTRPGRGPGKGGAGKPRRAWEDSDEEEEEQDDEDEEEDDLAEDGPVRGSAAASSAPVVAPAPVSIVRDASPDPSRSASPQRDTLQPGYPQQQQHQYPGQHQYYASPEA